MGITVKKIHKHRGKRWTVSVAGDFGREMFEWLSDNFGEEDFESGPWAQWYAWHPVTTINNERVWGKKMYRRTRYTIFKRHAGYEYATDFDLLKENDQ